MKNKIKISTRTIYVFCVFMILLNLTHWYFDRFLQLITINSMIYIIPILLLTYMSFMEDEK